MNENKRFINEYEYIPQIIKEATGAWWDYKFKKGYRDMTILLIMIIIISMITQNIKWLFLCIVPIIPITLIFAKKKIAIKTELERAQVIYKAKPPVVKLVLDEEITMTTSANERTLELKNIEAFVETKNLIVLMLKGCMTVAFDKNGFKEGTPEELLNYLSTLINKK